MRRPTPTTTLLGRRALLGLGALGGLTLAGCSQLTELTGVTDPAANSSGQGGATSVAAFLDPARVHPVAVSAAPDALAALVATYLSSGAKDWAQVGLTIDGTAYEQVGIRLKGNSSLRSVTADAEPQTLPWLIRLDQFIDGQAHQGMREFIVRSNSSTTALNEAVALDLLRASGLAAQQPAYLALSVNDSAAQLRLAVENPDQAWVDRVFAQDGLLYKADAAGDYTYRGTDPASYEDVFDQETGDDNLTPLITFLQFVNEASDVDFQAQLPDRLDVAAFARYLAFEDLVDNTDDIDGPGNNSYLWWAATTEQMTVVAWDHNLAFGLSPAGAGGVGGGAGPVGGGGPGGAGVPPGAGMPPAGANGQRGPGGKSNPLVTRFRAVTTWADAVTAARADLTASLVTSGTAASILQRWQALLTSQASQLVDAATVSSEAAHITDSLAT